MDQSQSALLSFRLLWHDRMTNMIGIGSRAEVDNNDGISSVFVITPIAMKTYYRLNCSLADADAHCQVKSKFDSNSITEKID